MTRHMSILTAVALALAATGASLVPETAAAHAQVEAPAREIEIVVDGGYQPARITITEGERVRLRFVRRDASPCTREVVFPSLGLRRELPTDQPVVIDLPPLPAGEVEFKCGMNMIRGRIIVQPREG
jgi:plastocyanin domain-containing protein